MDSQNPECNLHVESQRNASLENELFKVPFINRLYKMGNLHLKDLLVKPAQCCVVIVVFIIIIIKQIVFF